MSALYNNIEIVGVAMHVMLGTILANSGSNVFLQRGANRMLACVHVRNFRLFQSLGKEFPCPRLDIVGFTNVETPNVARRHLQDSKQVQHLLVTHSFIKVLSTSGG